MAAARGVQTGQADPMTRQPVTVALAPDEITKAHKSNPTGRGPSEQTQANRARDGVSTWRGGGAPGSATDPLPHEAGETVSARIAGHEYPKVKITAAFTSGSRWNYRTADGALRHVRVE